MRARRFGLLPVAQHHDRAGLAGAERPGRYFPRNVSTLTPPPASMMIVTAPWVCVR